MTYLILAYLIYMYVAYQVYKVPALMTTYHKQDEFDTLRNELESGQYYIDNQTNIHNFDYKQSRKSMVTQKWNS